MLRYYESNYSNQENTTPNQPTKTMKSMTSTLNLKAVLATLSLGIFMAGTSGAQTLIVAEDFGGDGTGNINGTTADTFASGITSASGSSTWVTPTSGYLDDGSISSDNSVGYLNLGSYINDSKGTASGKFTLSATLDVLSGNNWVGFGFFESNTPATDNNFTNTVDSAGMGVIIYRTSNALDGFPGPASGGPGSVTSGTGSGAPELLTIVLDLTPSAYDGSSNFGTITFYKGDTTSGTNIGAYTYDADQSFGSIGMTVASSPGTISDLALTQVPEASTSLLLAGLGMLTLLRRRR